jgi:hypothetical protein
VSRPAHPVAAEALADAVAALLLPGRPGLLRVALDGPSWAGTDDLADALLTPVRLAGRFAGVVRAGSFWRDASLRFEHGRADPVAFAEWLDTAALRREVLDRAVEQSSYLPSLRDPGTNRATRQATVRVPSDAVIMVAGPFLLGRGLPFDASVHVALTPGARTRRVPVDEHWTLPAFDAYDATVRPAEIADIVIRYDDPRHPALYGTPTAVTGGGSRGRRRTSK